MIDSLRHLLRYRALIASLVARDLKARYRGSFLGFFWSFVNPLLLLLIYTFIFTTVVPSRGGSDETPFALFLFCGLLPWTWFSTALVESSSVLIAGGNLIRKVLFPAEVLPIVTVLSGLVHFCFGLPILAGFFVYFGTPVAPLDLLWLPLVVLVQLLLTLGLSLLISALTVHFRDLRDLVANLLTLWFWATPIVYALAQVPDRVRPIIGLNPFTHLVVAYRDALLTPGPFTSAPRLAVLAVAALGVFLFGYFVFDRLRDTLAEEV